jgi:hypothetical protein
VKFADGDEYVIPFLPNPEKIPKFISVSCLEKSREKEKWMPNRDLVE